MTQLQLPAIPPNVITAPPAHLMPGVAIEAGYFCSLEFYRKATASMPKWYKKISWAVNGVIIGLIIAGLVNHSLAALILGAAIGLLAAVTFKILAWHRQRRDGW